MRKSYFILIKVNPNKLYEAQEAIKSFKNLLETIKTISRHFPKLKQKKLLRTIHNILDYYLSSDVSIEGVLAFLSELTLCDIALAVEYQTTLEITNILGIKLK